MSAVKQNVSSSDSCDDYGWNDGPHTLDSVNQLSNRNNRTNMTKAKIEAVQNAQRHQDVSSVRGFLGLVNYYHRFLPNISSVLHPLNQLLENENKWEWSRECEDAFKKAKRLVTSEQVLANYDPDLPVRVACDASPCCPNITKQNNEKIHNAISEVSKGDCIIMGDFNHGNIKWDSLQSTGVEDQRFLCLVQDNFLTQHVLEPTRAARVLDIVLSSQK